MLLRAAPPPTLQDARHSCLSTFRPSWVSLTETFESIFRAVKFVEQRPVAFRGFASLIETMNILAQDIHRGAKALRIQIARDANRVRHGFAGDVPLRDAAHDGFWDEG